MSTQEESLLYNSINDPEDTDYEDIPEWPDLDQLEIINDFLPPPEQLVYKKSEAEPVTVVLAEKTARYFHERSRETGVSHRYLIQQLLDAHVAQQLHK